MNRKILAVLLLSPVLVFAADRMIDLPAKKVHLTSNEEIKIKENPKDVIINSEELASELKASIKDRDGRNRAYDATEITGLWDDELVKPEVHKFLKTHVLAKLNKHNVHKLNLRESFSRCPSGYEVYIIKNDNKITSEGWMMSSSGCDYDPMARFRFDIPNEKVEVLVSEKAGFLPIDDYLKLYKAVSKDL